MANEFAGFEVFEGPEDGTQIVYGVNVLRVDAEVEADPAGLCVEQLVERYREMLGLPAAVTVFVDGVKFAPSDTIPEAARRIELVKPSGVKGVCLDQIEKIELADEDAVRVAVVRRDTIEYQATEEMGVMSANLIPRVDLGDLFVITADAEGEAKVGRMITKATRCEDRAEAVMIRRADSSLTINDVLSGMSDRPVEIRLDGEVLPDGRCQPLEAGDELIVVLPGETSQEPYERWAWWMWDNAVGAYWSAKIEHETAVAYRAEELVQMNWARIRVVGAHAGVKLAGLGRTRETIESDILESEFEEFPSRDDFIRSWLVAEAPEALDYDGYEVEPYEPEA